MIGRFTLSLKAFCLLLVCDPAFAELTNATKQPWPASISDEAAARRCFLEMERIARLPKPAQAKQVGHVYHDLFPPLEMRTHSMVVQDSAPANRNNLTPEAMATALAAKGGWVALFEAARAECLAVLQTNINELVPLVKKDLAGTNDNEVSRAFRAFSVFPLAQLYDDLVAVFQKNDKLAGYAAYALRDLNDPRAIGILIGRSHDRPTEYYEVLADLQRGRKADPALVRLLDSKDPEIRWQAAYALGDSGDSALVPATKKLLKDSDAQVREHAAVIAFNLPEKGFAQLRPDLVALLNDPNWKVRYQVAVSFAYPRMDKVCAPALLKLLRESGLEDWAYNNVIQRVNLVAGSYFGYELDQASTSPANKAAVRRFAAWAKENAK